MPCPLYVGAVQAELPTVPDSEKPLFDGQPTPHRKVRPVLRSGYGDFFEQVQDIVWDTCKKGFGTVNRFVTFTPKISPDRR
jgi:hypothetical protein